MPKYISKPINPILDNISIKSAEQFKQFSGKKSMALLQGYDRWLSAKDRDVNPELGGESRVRVGVGIYYFEENLEKDGDT